VADGLTGAGVVKVLYRCPGGTHGVCTHHFLLGRGVVSGVLFSLVLSVACFSLLCVPGVTLGAALLQFSHSASTHNVWVTSRWDAQSTSSQTQTQVLAFFSQSNVA
jgi:hypothetical protein